MAFRCICVFCGSNPGADPRLADCARATGSLLAGAGITLVYGGGAHGMMGALADAVLEDGGRAIGVVPDGLFNPRALHGGLSEMRQVASMHERKAAMAELADGFIALPGGIGTLEEIIEAWTWNQLGIQRKPCGLVNANGFYDPLLELMRNMLDQGYLDRSTMDLLAVAGDPERLLARMSAVAPCAPRARTAAGAGHDTAR